MKSQNIYKFFNSSTPTSNPKLLVGRETEKRFLVKSILKKGEHPMIFGLRGVGKTSLIKVVTNEIRKEYQMYLHKYTCSAFDNFDDIFSSFLNDLGKGYSIDIRKSRTRNRKKGSFGISTTSAENFIEKDERVSKTMIVPLKLNPNEVSKRLSGKKSMLWIDEFDRVVTERDVLYSKISDLIKTLSDSDVDCTIILSGVSNEIDELFSAHNSINRQLKCLKISGLEDSDLYEIISKGEKGLQITFKDDLKKEIVFMSSGLPFFTHLLSEKIMEHAIFKKKKICVINDFDSVIKDVIDEYSLRELNAMYDKTINRNKENNIFGSALREFEHSIPYNHITIESVLNNLAVLETDTNQCENILKNMQVLATEKALISINDISDIIVILDYLVDSASFLIKHEDRYVFKDNLIRAYIRFRSYSSQRKTIDNKR